jgi:hypothetical protein
MVTIKKPDIFVWLSNGSLVYTVYTKGKNTSLCIKQSSSAYHLKTKPEKG